MIRYLISSVARYAGVTLPRLLGSLTPQIESERILVVIGGAPAEGVEFRDGIEHRLVRQNSFDYTGPIAVLEHGYTSDWWFWLHDTCDGGPDFRERVETGFDPRADMTAGSLHGAGGALSNIGLYSHAVFLRGADQLAALRDCDKAAACHAEGFFWKQGLGQGAVYPGPAVIAHPAHDVYGTGTPRLREYYPALDLWKYKANWGAGDLVVNP